MGKTLQKSRQRVWRRGNTLRHGPVAPRIPQAVRRVDISESDVAAAKAAPPFVAPGRSSPLRTLCLTLPGTYERGNCDNLHDPSMSAKYFSALGLPVEYYLGTDGKRLGLRADGVTGKFLGTWLSHRSLWACMRLLPEDEFLVLEDDAKFCPDWQSRLTAAMECVPEDWDIINLGPCIKQVLAHVAGEVWTCEAWCLHACVIRKKALGAMIGAADEFGTKYTIDDGLLKFAYPRMHVYATLPSIVDQWAG